jgi:2-dehydro-3-deoxygluconokinase
MPELVKYCHVVMGNIWAVESLLGIASPIKESAGKATSELIDAAGNSMLQMHQQYPKLTSMAYTFRLEKEYWAVLQHGANKAISKEFTIDTVVDKVGSGDCFMAGLIYGFINQHDVKEIIDFAAASAVGKLQEAGDDTKQTIETINKKILQWTKNN